MNSPKSPRPSKPIWISPSLIFIELRLKYIYIYIHLFIYLSIYVFIYLFIYFLFIYFLIYLFISYFLIYLFIYIDIPGTLQPNNIFCLNCLGRTQKMGAPSFHFLIQKQWLGAPMDTSILKHPYFLSRRCVKYLSKCFIKKKIQVAQIKQLVWQILK